MHNPSIPLQTNPSLHVLLVHSIQLFQADGEKTISCGDSGNFLPMLPVRLRHAADHTSLNLVSTATPMIRQFPLMGTNGH